jgi:hypothetical protein
MSPQIKNETGHVPFRVLRKTHIGQNSVQLFESTGPYFAVMTLVFLLARQGAAFPSLLRARKSDGRI